MALDVWVGDWKDPDGRLALSFEPEAYYWLIYPLVDQLYVQHRKIIDLYGVCEFAPDELSLFRKLIDDAEGLVSDKPSVFSVNVGTQTHPVFEDIERVEFVRFLESLRVIANECERSGMPLKLYGD